MHCITIGDKIELRRAMKQLKLLTLPQVFIIHLKRFSIDHIITKNSTHIKYPAVIDVKEYCTEVRIQLDTVAKLKLNLLSWGKAIYMCNVSIIIKIMSYNNHDCVMANY